MLRPTFNSVLEIVLWCFKYIVACYTRCFWSISRPNSMNLIYLYSRFKAGNLGNYQQVINKKMCSIIIYNSICNSCSQSYHKPQDTHRWCAISRLQWFYINQRNWCSSLCNQQHSVDYWNLSIYVKLDKWTSTYIYLNNLNDNRHLIFLQFACEI